MKHHKSFSLKLAAVMLALCVSAWGAQLTSFTHTFHAGSGGTLIVELESGDVQVTPGASQVFMEVVGIDESDMRHLEYSEDSGTVRVRFEPDGWGSDARFEFTVPTNFNLDLKTAGGDISVEDRVVGEIKASTSGGDIVVQDVDGALSLTTAGGDIEAGIVTGTVAMKTAGGDISLESGQIDADLKTAGGDIEVGNVAAQLTAKTAGGDIILGNVGGTVSARTAGGDIEVQAVGGSADLKTAGGDIELLSVTGSVEAKTAGGDLELRGVEGSIQGKTSGGDVYAEILAGSGFGQSALETAGGDIEVRIPASANVTIEARIRISGRWSRESSEYTISGDLVSAAPTVDSNAREIYTTIQLGGGGPTVVLETVNGNIWINSLGY